MSRLVAAGFALALAFVAASRVVHADALDDETRRIGKQLQCPVCSGAAVSDSPSELAGQMRTVIRAKLRAGESEEQIVTYFVERYGDGVLIEPPRRGIGLVVWVVPFGALAVGGLLLWRMVRSWLHPRRSVALAASDAPATPYRNGTARADGPQSVSTVDRAKAELDRYRRAG